MDKRRIIAHIWMYILISLGVAVAFRLVPPYVLFSRINRYYLTFAIIPLLFFVLYNFWSAIEYRRGLSSSTPHLEELAKKKFFGRVVHPTCTTLAILAWMSFLYFPNLRMFLADVWMTVVIYFWIKLEKSAYSPKKAKSDDSEP